jgi:hypothetical protein
MTVSSSVWGEMGFLPRELKKPSRHNRFHAYKRFASASQQNEKEDMTNEDKMCRDKSDNRGETIKRTTPHLVICLMMLLLLLPL